MKIVIEPSSNKKKIFKKQFEFEEGRNTFRIIPFQLNGKWKLFERVNMHVTSSATGEYGEYRICTGKGTCPLCKKMSKYKDLPKDIYERVKPKARDVYRLLVDGRVLYLQTAFFKGFGELLESAIQEEDKGGAFGDDGDDVRVFCKEAKFRGRKFLNPIRVSFVERSEENDCDVSDFYEKPPAENLLVGPLSEYEAEQIMAEIDFDEIDDCDDDDDDDDDVKPRRKASRNDDDDDDVKPRRKASRNDDDDDVPNRNRFNGKRKIEEDDDEDDDVQVKKSTAQKIIDVEDDEDEDVDVEVNKKPEVNKKTEVDEQPEVEEKTKKVVKKKSAEVESAEVEPASGECPFGHVYGEDSFMKPECSKCKVKKACAESVE